MLIADAVTETPDKAVPDATAYTAALMLPVVDVGFDASQSRRYQPAAANDPVDVPITDDEASEMTTIFPAAVTEML
jgi:hypothetical protein